ncbi:MAG: GtrA family protein [Candidatus Cloacimonetes bacterium]|nr:GtrA family protein [Candidatus Cloacimonadota bacterium]
MIKLFKFVVAGGINTLFTYLIYVVLVLMGISYQTALVWEYIVGIVCGYLLQRFWTFRAGSNLLISFFKYISLYCLIFLLNSWLLEYLVERKSYNSLISQACCLIMLAGLSFFIQKKLVFVSK